MHPGLVGVVLQLDPVNGCVIVKVGHCTLKDCAAADTATNTLINSEHDTSAPTFMLDIPFPPEPTDCAANMPTSHAARTASKSIQSEMRYLIWSKHPKGVVRLLLTKCHFDCMRTSSRANRLVHMTACTHFVSLQIGEIPDHRSKHTIHVWPN